MASSAPSQPQPNKPSIVWHGTLEFSLIVPPARPPQPNKSMSRNGGRTVFDLPHKLRTDILSSKNGGRMVSDVPNEIAIDILSRLPTKDVVRLLSVSKRWWNLTSTHYLTHYFTRCRSPMVLYRCPRQYDYDYDYYLLDQWWEPTESEPESYKVGKHSNFKLLFSNGGLIVMQHNSDLIYRITNPIFDKNVVVTLSEELRHSVVYGVFFHPLLNEYCTLWKITVSGEFITEREEYRILNLGSKPCWRVISNPWSHKTRISHIPPMLINEHLYWAVEPKTGYKSGLSFPPDIMEFGIRNEEFTFIPSPVPKTYKCKKFNMNLLDTGGLLSFVWTSPILSDIEVNIWTLKDRARQLWTVSSYIIDTGGSYVHGRPISLVKDELLLNYFGVVVTCNLKICSVRTVKNNCKYSAFSTPHAMSLVSLRSCKPKIYMDKRGEVEKNRMNRRRCTMLDGVDKNPVTDKRQRRA